ncbi:hypothetical protein J5N97_005706 [Dioscorea zingiberensis]|uniref:Uncharacterized protein n=1 Tax=Dioscorea zingiberensis TaxID=325984 RepID=A0A9D5D8M3_9LILI|nr:hypothetical protein J5N97_005706 [Dioscorea zingiberensis]
MEEPRSSLHVCFGDHPTTLFDEFEKRTFEIQLNRAVLQRSFSEPSPVRLVMKALPMAPVIQPPSVSPKRGVSRLSRALNRFSWPVFGCWRWRREGGLENNNPQALMKKAFSKSCRVY